jgi:hypothetical protein
VVEIARGFLDAEVGKHPVQGIRTITYHDGMRGEQGRRLARHMEARWEPGSQALSEACSERLHHIRLPRCHLRERPREAEGEVLGHHTTSKAVAQHRDGEVAGEPLQRCPSPGSTAPSDNERSARRGQQYRRLLDGSTGRFRGAGSASGLPVGSPPSLLSWSWGIASTTSPGRPLRAR